MTSTQTRIAANPLPPLTTGSYSRRLATITIVATFGGLLFGYDTGVINGALGPMSRDLGLDPTSEGLITSTLLFGAAIGSLFIGRLADIVGRRPVILLLAIIFFVSAASCVVAPGLAILLAARFVLGIAVGGASVIVPAFIAELSPTERRGSMMTRNELMIVSGQFAAFVINAVIGNVWGEQEGVWRWMLAFATVPALCLFFGMLRVPESPRWLMHHGREAEALAVLRQIRSEDRAVAELAEVRMLAHEEQISRTGGLRDLTKPWVLKLIAIATGLTVAGQLSGINSIMYYGTQLLTDAGFTANGALIANAANGAISILAVILCFNLIPRMGRRRMLTIGFVGTTTSHLAVGLSSLLIPEGTGRAATVLVFVVLFVGFVQGFIAPVMWIMLSELLPLRFRGIGIGIAVFFLWMVNFGVSLAFPPLVAAAGISATFFIFAAINLVIIFFIRSAVPETGGRSLEELEETFSGAIRLTNG